MAARVSTNCCSRRSASPPTAGRCIRRWPGTGSGWRRSCARTARTRFLPSGAAPNAGDIFRNPALAETLRAIARHGAKAFYEGAVAADIVATLRARGGLHTEEDFADGLTNAEFVEPITLNWHGYDVYQCPPNGQGIIALMILGMLGGLPSAADGPLGALRYHRHIEAARLAYRDRDAFVADPSQVDVPVKKLLSTEYLSGLRALIDDGKALRGLPSAGETLLPPHRDTIYLCVVDQDGNACSFINSLFEGFGSAILAERSGVMLQNRGFGFRVERGHPNCIAPRKRPMHTIIPGMVMKDGQAVMPYGVMGGHFQPMGHSLFLTNMLEYGLDIQEALDLPRLFPLRGKVQIERGIPRDISDEAGATRPRRWRRWNARMAAARRSGSTARAAASSAALSHARTGWRWDTDMTEPCDLTRSRHAV